MPRADMVPWLLWGDKETVKVSSSPGAAFASSAFQLAKIDYKRPETWTFFFGAKILNPPAPNLATNVRLDVNFDLMIGIGRSFFDTQYDRPILQQHFCNMAWVWLAGPTSRETPPRYATQVLAPALDDTAPTVRQVVSSFPAESIQVQGNVRLTAFEPVEVKVQLSAFFAPRTHVRPDWYQVDGVPFAGGETGGR
jgi:hypothetical protein